jgi:hypothetical protein
MVSEESKKSRIILIAGGSYLDREKLITTAYEAYLSPLKPLSAVILEGIPTGNSLLDSFPQLLIERVASGCFCCIGQLVMKVTLNRILRKHPLFVYIGISDSQHLINLQDVLYQPPYKNWLEIEKVIQLP